MTHATPLLAHIRRPRLLVNAARFGLSAFRRESVLMRLFGGTAPAPGPRAFNALRDLEASQDAERRSGDAAYSVSHHVEILTVLMAEALLVSGSTRPDPS